MSEGNLRTWRFPLDRRRTSLVRYLVEYSAFFLWAFAWVTLRSLRHRPDVVYINSPPDVFVFTALVPRLMGIPVILDVHDPMPELFMSKGRSSKVVRWMLEAQERWSLRFADRVITVHEPLRQLLQSRVPDVPIDVVMNVPDMEGWEPIGWVRDSRVVVFTGTVAMRYGLDDLLRAVVAVNDEVPGVRLRIVGEGEDEDTLREMAEELGVGDLVEFLGRVPYRQIPAVLADAWVGVNVPKPDELGNLSFSNKIVEWVLLGIPVIAGRTPTLLRYFPEGTLFYVEPGSPRQIADALVELSNMAASEIDMRRTAAREAVKAISWPVQRRRLTQILAEITGGGADPDPR